MKKAKQPEDEPFLNGRLILLNQKQYGIPNSHVTVLGCALWSKIPRESRDIVGYKIQDFHQVGGWTVDSHDAPHELDSMWLVKEIESIREENKKAEKQDQTLSVLVVTNHAPSRRKISIPKHENNLWSCVFGTDTLPQIAGAVKTWIFGHMHYTTDFKYRGTRIVSNPRRYVFPWPQPKENDKFDAGKIVCI